MIFPSLKGKKFQAVNLNTLAEEWLMARYGKFPAENPLNDPETCAQMVQEFHEREGLAYSYGGYLEDRSLVWAGSYLEGKGMFLHLGVDLNAPTGTGVALDREAEVIFVDDDAPLIGGWGAHVMFRLADGMYILYAHLARDISCKAGDRLAVGAIFARVGTPEENGNWYPHVHVQALAPETYEQYAKDINALDGYGKVSEKDLLAKQFPDPMQWVEAR